MIDQHRPPRAPRPRRAAAAPLHQALGRPRREGLSGVRNDLLLTAPTAMTAVEISIEAGIPREEPA
jgi:hypothetical protein